MEMQRNLKRASAMSTILIVDDSSIQLETLRRFLVKHNYRIITAIDGAEGLAKVQKENPSLIISDILMPVMDGYQMCEAVKSDKKLRDIPVILLTQLTLSEDVIKGVHAGADCYMTKPCDTDLLLAKIELFLSGDHVIAHADDDKIEHEVIIDGSKYILKANSGQILKQLIATYDYAATQNQNLLETQKKLKDLNKELQLKVNALQESENHLTSLMQTIPDIVYRIDTKGNFTFVNDSVKKLGYEVEELIGKHFSTIIKPTEINVISREEILKECVAKNRDTTTIPKFFDERRTGVRKTVGLEVRVLGKNVGEVKEGFIENIGDNELIVEVNSSGMYQINQDANSSSFIGTIGVIRDITNRKETERELFELHERLSKKDLFVLESKYLDLVENSADPIISINSEGGIILWNDAASEIFEYTKEDTREMSLEKIIPIDNCAGSSEYVQFFFSNASTLTTGKTIQLDGMKKSGMRVPLDISITTSRDNEEKPVATMILRDITERKKLEERLFHSEKINSLGTLVGGIAHDFNNMLTTLMGHSELLLDEIKDNDRAIEQVKTIARVTERAKSLTSQLLAFGRKQVLESRVVNLNNIINDIKEMFERLLGEDVKLTVQLDECLKNVMADPAKLEQVLMNLVVNSRHAMPTGGTLKISTNNIYIDKEYKGMHPESYIGEFVQVTVEDSGHGMSKEVIKDIFDPFFTTKEMGIGTGLGLSVVYGILKQHDGWVSVYSEEGNGTTFNVFLPVTYEKEKETPILSETRKDFDGTGERILVVEDDDAIREMVMQVLSKHGYIPIVVENAEEAIKLFIEEEGNFGLIFTDMVMPGKSGLELVEEIHLINPAIPVLLSSGYTEESSQSEKIINKGYNFIQKPYPIKKLLSTLSEII